MVTSPSANVVGETDAPSGSVGVQLHDAVVVLAELPSSAAPSRACRVDSTPRSFELS